MVSQSGYRSKHIENPLHSIVQRVPHSHAQSLPLRRSFPSDLVIQNYGFLSFLLNKALEDISRE